MARTPDSYFQWTPRSQSRNRLTNIYEPLQPYFLAELAKSVGCTAFVDIGANIGFYAIFMSSEIEAASIIAFEPISITANEARQNIALNGLDQLIDLKKVALSSTSGTATMSVINDLSGANSIIETSIHGAIPVERHEEVPQSTLDIEVPLTGKTIAMKIDVEGHELEVLKGAPQFLSQNKLIVQMENYRPSDSSADPAKLLLNLGFRRLIDVGPDQYFASSGLELDETGAVERALARFTEASKEPAALVDTPIRKRLFKGVVVEFTPRLSRMIRGAFSR